MVDSILSNLVRLYKKTRSRTEFHIMLELEAHNWALNGLISRDMVTKLLAAEAVIFEQLAENVILSNRQMHIFS